MPKANVTRERRSAPKSGRQKAQIIDLKRQKKALKRLSAQPVAPAAPAPMAPSPGHLPQLE